MNSAVGSKLSLRERRVFDEKAARVLVLGGAACARNESDGVASGVVSVDLHHAVPRVSLSVAEEVSGWLVACMFGRRNFSVASGMGSFVVSGVERVRSALIAMGWLHPVSQYATVIGISSAAS